MSYTELFEDIYNEVSDIIDATLGYEVPFHQKEELNRSISRICQNYFRDLLNEKSNDNSIYSLTTNFPFYSTAILNAISPYNMNPYYMPMQPQITSFPQLSFNQGAPVPQLNSIQDQPYFMFNNNSPKKVLKLKSKRPKFKKKKSNTIQKASKIATNKKQKQQILSSSEAETKISPLDQSAPSTSEQEEDPSTQEKSGVSYRPPNAFILYSQEMRSEARQQNPSLSNTEISRILGKMWKEVPNDVKIKYKEKAAKMQEEFKQKHPDYTYRKARRKRALEELLQKSSTNFARTKTSNDEDDEDEEENKPEQRTPLPPSEAEHRVQPAPKSSKFSFGKSSAANQAQKSSLGQSLSSKSEQEEEPSSKGKPGVSDRPPSAFARYSQLMHKQALNERHIKSSMDTGIAKASNDEDEEESQPGQAAPLPPSEADHRVQPAPKSSKFSFGKSSEANQAQKSSLGQSLSSKSEQEEDPSTQEKSGVSDRPPNAFILYSQEMRSEARQQNPSLSNTEISRILGKMWKEVPNDVKIKYKEKAAKLQEEFKQKHPDYTYRKARRKRALEELLQKSSTSFARTKTSNDEGDEDEEENKPE